MDLEIRRPEQMILASDRVASFRPLAFRVPACCGTAFDAYEVLGVPHTATQHQIQARFLELTREHHPDLHPGDETYTRITKAYTLLADPVARARHDLDRQSTAVQLRYYTAARHVIGVGIATGFPGFLRGLLDLPELALVPPSFAGPTGLLLALQPLLLGAVRGSISVFDTIGAVVWGAVGWLFRPTLRLEGDKLHVVGLLGETIRVSRDGEATCGDECVVRLNTNGSAEGAVEGTYTATSGVLGGTLSAELRGAEQTRLHGRHVRLPLVDVWWYHSEGFTVGLVVCFRFLSWRWWRAMFHTPDAQVATTCVAAAFGNVF